LEVNKLIQKIQRKICLELESASDDRWYQTWPFIKMDLNYKYLTKVEENKKIFLNSFYILVIYQLRSDNITNSLNNAQLRKELKFNNNLDYPKESIKLKPSDKTFANVS
jgi:hypothetical protein